MTAPLDENFVNQFGSTLAGQIEQTLISGSLPFLERGEGNIDAAQLTALTNVLAVRLNRLQVSEQDAVNALVQTMRTIKKMMDAQSRSSSPAPKSIRKAGPR